MDGPDDERLRFSRHVTGTSLFPAAGSVPPDIPAEKFRTAVYRKIQDAAGEPYHRTGRRIQRTPSLRSRSGCPPEDKEDDAIGGRPYGSGDPNRAALTPYACSAPVAYRFSSGTSGLDRARRPQASGSALSRSGLRNDMTALMIVFILKSCIESTVSCIESRD